MELKKRKVALTGGGTVGHVMLNKLMIPCLINRGYNLSTSDRKKGLRKK
ncbi:hypothetical protein [Salinicoccus sp. CNSTN-B1]